MTRLSRIAQLIRNLKEVNVLSEQDDINYSRSMGGGAIVKINLQEKDSFRIGIIELEFQDEFTAECVETTNISENSIRLYITWH